jgi:ABC-2 type transport system permease protein
MFAGLIHHLLFTLKLNFRSRQAIIYGYLVPVFFLIAFGALFRWTKPPLLAQMGELLTISALGGSCFGMPTGMVSDRERGVWRRYRLLPASTAGLVISTMVARFVLVASAGLLQIGLARWWYGTDFPLHPFQLLIAFLFVAFSFEAMGLVIAAAADNVPAVQALGMAIFLPMIMIGGVGVPLANLPNWAQKVAGFLPGRYAVEALQPCFDQPSGLSHAAFALIALLVIGIAGCIAGGRLFRWDANQQFRSSARGWVLIAVASWVAVGLTASATGHLKPVKIASTHPIGDPWMTITQTQIDSIRFDGMPPDDGVVNPVSPAGFVSPIPEEKQRLDQIRQQLDAWAPGHTTNDGQTVRNLLAAASVADIAQDPSEGPIARLVFDRLTADFDHDELIHILAWIHLVPSTDPVITDAPDLDIHGPVDPSMVRDRSEIYALKLLGRLIGKIPEQ